MAAIKAATSVAAAMLRWEDKVGALQTGRHADVIGVVGNPLDDLSLLEFPVFVMKGGKVIDLDN